MLVGSQEYSTESGEVYNDIVFPEEEEDAGIGKRHFIIKYNPDNQRYHL